MCKVDTNPICERGSGTRGGGGRAGGRGEAVGRHRNHNEVNSFFTTPGQLKVARQWFGRKVLDRLNDNNALGPWTGHGRLPCLEFDLYDDRKEPSDRQDRNKHAAEANSKYEHDGQQRPSPQPAHNTHINRNVKYCEPRARRALKFEVTTIASPLGPTGVTVEL
jgi:hypothetical protein